MIQGNTRALPRRPQLGAEIIRDLAEPVGLHPPLGAVQVRITVDGAPVQWTRGPLFDWRPWVRDARTLPVGATLDCASGLRRLRFVGMAPGAAIDVRFYGRPMQAD